MSQSGNRTVEVVLPDPDNSIETRIEEINARMLSAEERIATIASEAREWTTEQIQAAITRLETMEQEHQNLRATATQGMENLSDQMTEMRNSLQDLLTRRLPEAPLVTEETLVAVEETPPVVPRDGEEEGTQTDAPAPDVSQNGPEHRQQPQPKRKHVI